MTPDNCIFWLWLLMVCSVTQAQSFKPSETVRVCAVDGRYVLANEPPDFSQSVCQDQALHSLDPQGQLLWLELRWQVAALGDQPLSLFISGKQSSRVYLNGQLVGHNGQPARLAEDEVAGMMDAVFYLPERWTVAGENRIQLLLSAHQGLFTLSQPIHRIFVGNHHRPTNEILRHYWPSLLPFGVLVLGFFYLALVAWLNHLPSHAWLLPVMAMLAATQLFAEVIRGIVPYPYPWHDIRLMVILLCSIGFGLCLLSYVLHSISIKMRWLHVLLFGAVSAPLLWWVPGFDSKSVLALVLPVAAAMTYLLIARRRQSGQHDLVLLLFAGFLLMVLLNAWRFIDTIYYYYVALLVFLLMARQARQARRRQLAYQARAQQLEQVIEQQQLQQNSDRLTVRSAGKTEWVLVRELAYCKGAGDYVELVALNGQVKLYHGSLTELTKRLPSVFIRTHRSYLVNSGLIESLERSPTGVGELILTNHVRVPVSKRIMPHLRTQLS